MASPCKVRAKSPAKQLPKTAKKPSKNGAQARTRANSPAKTASSPKPRCSQALKEYLKRSKADLSPAQIKALHKAWYAKLAKDGQFKDLERPLDTPPGETPLLRGASLVNIADSFNTEQRHYYARWATFLTFNAKHLDARTRFAAVRYAKGMRMRQISALGKARGLERFSLTCVFKIIDGLRPRVLQWNFRSHHGLDYESVL